MKRWHRFLLLLLLLVGLGWYVLYHVLPKQAAKVLAGKKDITWMPEAIQEDVRKIQQNVDSQMVKLPAMLDSVSLDYEDLIVIVEKIDQKEALAWYESVKDLEQLSVEEALRHAEYSIDIQPYNLADYKPFILRNISESKLHRLVQFLNNNESYLHGSFPIFKETIRYTLEEKQDSVRQLLQEQH